MFRMFGNTLEAPHEIDPRQKVLASLEEAEFHGKPDENVIRRMALLEQKSKFNEDSRLIEHGMVNVLDILEKKYAEEYPQLELAPEQRVDARVAAILHDIGKSGPAEATPKEQEIIVKVFADENIRNPELSVAEALPEIFGAEQNLGEIWQSLEKLGIRTGTTMRQFWDMHAQWTHDILEKYPQSLSGHARVIAGSHHIDHGVNPYGLRVGEIPAAANVIGALEDYSDALGGRVLIALDKYEAQIRRSEKSHEEAIGWVRENLAKSEKFKNDMLMGLVLEAVDDLGKARKIFEKK